MDPGKGGRSVGGSLLPCGLYHACGAEPAMSVRAKADVWSVVQNGLGDYPGFWWQPQVFGSPDGNDRHPAHLGAEPVVASAPSLHSSRGWHCQITQMETHQE